MLNFSLIGLAVVAVLGWLISTNKLKSKSSLSRLPLLKFDRDDTQQRYVTSSGEILHRGYQKVLKILYFRATEAVSNR